MKREKWAIVPSLRGKFEISNYGRFRKHFKKYDSPVLINGSVMVTGYLCFSIIDRQEFAHRLVAMFFVQNPQNHACVNHKDGNKLNNYFENLEWCDHKHNNKHARETGLWRPVMGTRVNTCKLTEKDVLKIYNSKEKNTVLSAKYRVDSSVIYEIKAGKIWKSVTGGADVSIKRKVLGAATISNILNHSGTKEEISTTFSVAISTINRLLRTHKYQQEYKKLL